MDQSIKLAAKEMETYVSKASSCAVSNGRRNPLSQDIISL